MNNRLVMKDWKDVYISQGILVLHIATLDTFDFFKKGFWQNDKIRVYCKVQVTIEKCVFRNSTLDV